VSLFRFRENREPGSEKALVSLQKRHLATPRKGRRAGAVLHAPSRAFPERRWFGAPFHLGTFAMRTAPQLSSLAIALILSSLVIVTVLGHATPSRAADKKRKPTDAAGLVEQGNAHFAQKQPVKAIAAYSEAIRLDPKFAEAYGRRAHAYEVRGENDKAIEDATDALQLDPKCWIACYSRGYAWCHKGEYDKAIEDLTKAIELAPTSSRAYYGRGNAHGGKQDYDRAIKDYTKAIEISPNYAAAYKKRSAVYSKTAQNELAKADSIRAKRLESKTGKSAAVIGGADKDDLLVPPIGQGPFADGVTQKYQAGNFSYIPPQGWKMVGVSGKRFRIATGPVRDGFAPNIDVAVDPGTFTVADTYGYVKKQVDDLRASFADFNLIKNEEFDTDLLFHGRRIVYEATVIVGRPKVRQTMVFIVLLSQMHIITCSTLAEGGPDLDALFDRSLRTFRMDLGTR
jgi:tetratricopeptide (TPR) repeat protein